MALIFGMAQSPDEMLMIGIPDPTCRVRSIYSRKFFRLLLKIKKQRIFKLLYFFQNHCLPYFEKTFQF